MASTKGKSNSKRKSKTKSGSKPKSIAARVGNALVSIFVYGCFLISIVAFFGIFFGEDSGCSESDFRSLECTQDDMDITIDQDGTMDVVDARTYTFHGAYTLIGYRLDAPYWGQSEPDGVSVIEDGVRTDLQYVPFDTDWRTEGGPGDGYWAYDETRESIYAFSDSDDTTKTYEFRFAYQPATKKYEDVAELYWQFIPAGWDVDTQNVTATVHLPVPEGQTVNAADNVYAWAHSEDRGSCQFNDDGTITYTYNRVTSGNFAEMRIVFPASWVPEQDGGYAYPNLDNIRNIEQETYLAAERQAYLDRMALLVPAVISLVLCAIAAVLLFRYGREHKPTFTREWYSDVPAPGVHPVVVQRICNWNSASDREITATLMNLSALGIVSVSELKDPGEAPDNVQSFLEGPSNYAEEIKLADAVNSQQLVNAPGFTPEGAAAGDVGAAPAPQAASASNVARTTERTRRSKRDYRIHRMAQNVPGTDPLDLFVMTFLFDTVGGGSDDVLLSDIKRFGKKHPEEFEKQMDAWNKLVSERVDAGGYFEKTGSTLNKTFVGLGIAYPAIFFAISFFIANLSPWLVSMPAAIALLVLAHFMKRRSQEAADINAKCEALKYWFENYSTIKSTPSSDGWVWGQLFVYAYLFDLVAEAFRIYYEAFPDTSNGDRYVNRGPLSNNYLLWSQMSGPAASDGGLFVNTFQKTLENTQSSVNATLHPSSSGGGGGGGGSSSGGGGGFGGGGGGFSR